MKTLFLAVACYVALVLPGTAQWYLCQRAATLATEGTGALVASTRINSADDTIEYTITNDANPRYLRLACEYWSWAIDDWIVIRYELGQVQGKWDWPTYASTDGAFALVNVVDLKQFWNGVVPSWAHKGTEHSFGWAWTIGGQPLWYVKSISAKVGEAHPHTPTGSMLMSCWIELGANSGLDP